MTAKKKVTPSERMLLYRIIAKVDINKLVGSLIALGVAWVGYKQYEITSHHDQEDQKQEQVVKVDSSWRIKSEKRWIKVDSNFSILNNKLDSVLKLKTKIK